jgi:hypothetical protein
VALPVALTHHREHLLPGRHVGAPQAIGRHLLVELEALAEKLRVIGVFV